MLELVASSWKIPETPSEFLDKEIDIHKNDITQWLLSIFFALFNAIIFNGLLHYS